MPAALGLLPNTLAMSKKCADAFYPGQAKESSVEDDFTCAKFRSLRESSREQVLK